MQESIRFDASSRPRMHQREPVHQDQETKSMTHLMALIYLDLTFPSAILKMPQALDTQRSGSPTSLDS